LRRFAAHNSLFSVCARDIVETAIATAAIVIITNAVNDRLDLLTAIFEKKHEQNLIA